MISGSSENVKGGKEINENLSLLGSPSTVATTTGATTSTKTNEKNCVVCAPGGLATSSLNLSSIGPLCTNIGCKDSSNRMSRSASPALGGDNPRLSSIY